MNRDDVVNAPAHREHTGEPQSVDLCERLHAGFAVSVAPILDHSRSSLDDGSAEHEGNAPCLDIRSVFHLVVFNLHSVRLRHCRIPVKAILADRVRQRLSAF